MSSTVTPSKTKKGKKESLSKTNPSKDTSNQLDQEKGSQQPQVNLQNTFQEDGSLRTTIVSSIKRTKKKKKGKKKKAPSTLGGDTNRGFLTPTKTSARRSAYTRSPSPTYKQSNSKLAFSCLISRKLKERIIKSEDEDDEARNSILIIKRQEIEAKILNSQEEVDSEDEKKLIRKEIKKEKFFDLAYSDLQEKIYREASPVREEVSKAKKPGFRLELGKEYIEKQVVRTHATEIIPRKKLHLIPLLERNEHILSTEVDRNLFNEDERKIVAARRKEYSNRGRGVIREIIMTEVLRKKLDATILIQRWFRRYSERMKMRRATLVKKENVVNTRQLAEEVKKLAEEEKEHEREEELHMQRLEELRAMQEAEILRKIDFNDPKKRNSMMDPTIKELMHHRRASAVVPIWARETLASESKHVTKEVKEDEPLFKLKTPSKKNSARNSLLMSDTRSHTSSRRGTITEELSKELKDRQQERRASETLPIWAKETKASATRRSSQTGDHLIAHNLHEENQPKPSIFKKKRNSTSVRSDEHENSSQEESETSREAIVKSGKKSSSSAKKRGSASAKRGSSSAHRGANEEDKPYVSVHNDPEEEGGVIYKKKHRESKFESGSDRSGSVSEEQVQQAPKPYVSIHNDPEEEGGVIYKKKQREGRLASGSNYSAGAAEEEEAIEEEKKEEEAADSSVHSEKSDAESQGSAVKANESSADNEPEEIDEKSLVQSTHEDKPLEKKEESEVHTQEKRTKSKKDVDEKRKSEIYEEKTHEPQSQGKVKSSTVVVDSKKSLGANDSRKSSLAEEKKSEVEEPPQAKSKQSIPAGESQKSLTEKKSEHDDQSQPKSKQSIQADDSRKSSLAEKKSEHEDSSHSKSKKSVPASDSRKSSLAEKKSEHEVSAHSKSKQSIPASDSRKSSLAEQKNELEDYSHVIVKPSTVTNEPRKSEMVKEIKHDYQDNNHNRSKSSTIAHEPRKSEAAVKQKNEIENHSQGKVKQSQKDVGEKRKSEMHMEKSHEPQNQSQGRIKSSTVAIDSKKSSLEASDSRKSSLAEKKSEHEDSAHSKSKQSIPASDSRKSSLAEKKNEPEDYSHVTAKPSTFSNEPRKSEMIKEIKHNYQDSAHTRSKSSTVTHEPRKSEAVIEQKKEIEDPFHVKAKQSILVVNEPRKPEALIPLSEYYAKKESLPSTSRSQQQQTQSVTPVDSVPKTPEETKSSDYGKKNYLLQVQKCLETKPTQQYTYEVRRSSAQDRPESANNYGSNSRVGGVTNHILSTTPLSEKIKQTQNAALGKLSGSKKKYIPDYTAKTTINYLNRERGSPQSYSSLTRSKDVSRLNKTPQKSAKTSPTKTVQKTTPPVKTATTTQRNKYLPSNFREIKKSLPQVDVLLSAARELETAAAITIQRYFRKHLVDMYKKSNTIDMIQKDFSEFLKGVCSEHEFSFKPAMQALALSYIKKTQRSKSP